MLGCMTARTRKVVVILGAGALIAAGCGGTAASSGSGSPPAQSQNGGGPDLATLAGKLGVSESALQKAMRSARPSQDSQPADMAAAPAKALGLSEAKLQAALQALGPPGGGSAPPQGTTS
jgi:hypothetical protein